MTSRLSRVARLAARVEAEQADRARVASTVHRYEIGQLIEESVPMDEIIDLTREVHAGHKQDVNIRLTGDAEAETRLLELVAEAAERWENGARPRGDHSARELLDREKRESRQRLGQLRH